jgi:hypothetical protein
VRGKHNFPGSYPPAPGSDYAPVGIHLKYLGVFENAAAKAGSTAGECANIGLGIELRLVLEDHGCPDGLRKGSGERFHEVRLQSRIDRPFILVFNRSARIFRSGVAVQLAAAKAAFDAECLHPLFDLIHSLAPGGGNGAGNVLAPSIHNPVYASAERFIKVARRITRAPKADIARFQQDDGAALLGQVHRQGNAGNAPSNNQDIGSAFLL